MSLVRIVHGDQVKSEYQAPVTGPLITIDPWAKTISVGEVTTSYAEDES